MVNRAEMESPCGTSLLLSPLNLLSIASLSICFFCSTFSIHSLASLLPFILKTLSVSLTSFLLLFSSCPSFAPSLHPPLPPSPLLSAHSSPPSLSGSSILARHCGSSFFFFFNMPLMSQVEFVYGVRVCVCVCVCVCVSVSQNNISLLWTVWKRWSTFSQPPCLHPTAPTHSVAHFHSHKGVNLSEMSGVLTNSQLLAICLCVCVCVCVCMCVCVCAREHVHTVAAACCE